MSETTLNAVLNRTSRDLLEEIGGEDHALHTVVSKARTYRGKIKFTCVCGEVFEAQSTAKNTGALRNVPEDEE